MKILSSDIICIIIMIFYFTALHLIAKFADNNDFVKYKKRLGIIFIILCLNVMLTILCNLQINFETKIDISNQIKDKLISANKIEYKVNKKTGEPYISVKDSTLKSVVSIINK